MTRPSCSIAGAIDLAERAFTDFFDQRESAPRAERHTGGPVVLAIAGHRGGVFVDGGGDQCGRRAVRIAAAATAAADERGLAAAGGDSGGFGLIESLRRRAFFFGVRAMQLCHAGNEPELANDTSVVFAWCVRLQGLPINEMPVGNRRGQIDEAFLWSHSRHFVVPAIRRMSGSTRRRCVVSHTLNQIFPDMCVHCNE
jgi:hypothetical protein